MEEVRPALTAVRFGPFELSVDTGELRKEGVRLKLSGQPIQVLMRLVATPGKLVTREELQQQLWPGNTFGDFEKGLNPAVTRLRENLNDSATAPRYIETIPGRGYRFIGEVGQATATAAAPAPKAGAALNSTSSAASPTSVPVRERRFASTRMRVWLGTAAALALFALAWMVYRSSSAKNTPQPAIKSLAVLPLKNLSGDPAQEYLADGMTEELIGRLSGIRDLRVVSRTSAMQFKDTKMSAPEIAKALHVDALVEGSVIRAGNRIRVHAQLIRGSTDEHLWSEEYDRDLKDVLALQSDLAQAIAGKVAVTVTGPERARLVAKRKVSREAYESNLKGQFVLEYRTNSRADVEQSIAYFQDAIERDPSFAQAYVGLGAAYETLDTATYAGDPQKMLTNALTAAQKALELDPELVDAHLLLADLRSEQYQ